MQQYTFLKFRAHAKIYNQTLGQVIREEAKLTNLLVPYVTLSDHHDPILDEFTYGDVDRRAKKLKRDLKKGDKTFLHTTIRGHKYITAYYIVDRVMDTSEAASKPMIVKKYKNPHILEYLNGERRGGEDVIVFGDPILSKKLDPPLKFDRTLAEKLSLDISFKEHTTDLQDIGSATRAWRPLTEEDVNTLFEEIKRVEEEAIDTDTILSTDEVLDIREVDLENFVVQNPEYFGSGLTFLGRQIDTKEGRLDLLFEDASDELVIVELKLHEIGRKALNQLRRYMRQVEKDYKKKVNGVLLCKDVLPTYVNEFGRLKDIRIFHYGWKLSVYPRKWE